MRITKAIFGIVLLIFISSCEDLLEVADISEETVQLLAPSDSTTVAQNMVNFSWNGVYEATQYHIQVASPNFENAAQIIIDSVIVIDSTFLGTRITKSLANSQYEWRVKAMNSDFETDFSSSLFNVDTSSN